tara:strand:- start:157 stop:345 length:189 start_codon:yes stop_codon:yes gene_type:complete
MMTNEKEKVEVFIGRNDFDDVLCHVYDIKKVVDQKLLLENSDEYTVGDCLSDVIEILEGYSK